MKSFRQILAFRISHFAFRISHFAFRISHLASRTNYVIVLLTLFSLIPQTKVHSQDDFCQTQSGPDYIQYLKDNNIAITKSLSNDYIRVYFHVIRKSDGTGGRSMDDVYQMLENLREDFAPHDIFFQLECIDYIDNDVFYSFEDNNKFGAQVYNIIGTNYHTDGIDIYVYSGENDPNSNQDDYEGGLADVPSASNLNDFFSFILIGGLTDENELKVPAGIDFALSNALTHEMGHCLGLHHTFRGSCGSDPTACIELVNGSNALDCGDLVEDTPADPGIDFSTDFTTCIWNGGTRLNTPLLDSQGNPVLDEDGNAIFVPCYHNYVDPQNRLYPLDENGHVYNPSTNNYMAYVIPSCMTQFTNSTNEYSQFDKMKETIAMHPGLAPILVQNPIHPVNWFDDIQISTGTTTWNQNRHIFGTVTIPANATLEIIGTPTDNVVISFAGNDAGIVVEEGGRLIIENAVLNNSCLEDDYWWGIKVEGDTNKNHPSDFITNGSPDHGIVSITNSQMESSHNGIHAIGGIIGTEGTNRFINNRIGISLTYQFGTQLSYIQNNDFVINRPVPHPLYNEYRQVVGYQCGNLNLFNNEFMVDDSSGEDLGFTTAILVMNTPTTIGMTGFANTFEKFSSGIRIYNFLVTLPTFIEGNTFTDVQHGVLLNTTAMPTVTENIFHIPNGTSTSDAYGLMTYRLAY